MAFSLPMFLSTLPQRGNERALSPPNFWRGHVSRQSVHTAFYTSNRGGRAERWEQQTHISFKKGEISTHVWKKQKRSGGERHRKIPHHLSTGGKLIAISFG